MILQQTKGDRGPLVASTWGQTEALRSGTGEKGGYGGGRAETRVGRDETTMGGELGRFRGNQTAARRFEVGSGAKRSSRRRGLAKIPSSPPAGRQPETLRRAANHAAGCSTPARLSRASIPSSAFSRCARSLFRAQRIAEERLSFAFAFRIPALLVQGAADWKRLNLFSLHLTPSSSSSSCETAQVGISGLE